MTNLQENKGENMELELMNEINTDTFSLYIRDIRDYPVLSIEEQKQLVCAYQNGDMEARDILIKANQRLVVKVASRYKERVQHLDFLDLIQEGNIGLMRALETYNPEKSSFSTYAVLWIKQTIHHSLETVEDDIRKPAYLHQKIKQYKQIVARSQMEGIPHPSDSVICDALHITNNQLNTIQTTIGQNPISINQVIDEEEKGEVGDFIALDMMDFDTYLNQTADRDLLLAIKEMFTPVQYYVIYFRVLSSPSKSLESLGSTLGLTRQRVRQMEKHVLQKLKPYMLHDEKRLGVQIMKVKQKYGKDYNRLKETPIQPDDIILYMYLKDDLTTLESQLLYYQLLDSFVYTPEACAKKLGISLPDYFELDKKLQERLQKSLQDTEQYKAYKQYCIQNYKAKMYYMLLQFEPQSVNDVDVSKKDKPHRYQKKL